MQRVRGRLQQWDALALALCLSSFTTPRAALYFHHHTRGDHVHVHADDSDHDGIDGPHSHTHVAKTAGNGPEIEAPDDDGTGHWHLREFFHRAVAPAVAGAQHVERIEIVGPLPERSGGDRPALPDRVRGPPLPA